MTEDGRLDEQTDGQIGCVCVHGLECHQMVVPTETPTSDALELGRVLGNEPPGGLVKCRRRFSGLERGLRVCGCNTSLCADNAAGPRATL